MRAFFATFQIGVKYLFRNPISIILYTAFPIVMILILGNALSSYISPDTSLDPAPVAVAADPDGQLAVFLQRPEISRFFTLTFSDRPQVEQMVADGGVCAAIIEDGGNISVLKAPGSGMDTELTLSVVDSYRQISAAAATAAMSGRDVSELLNADVSVTDKPLGKRVPTATDYYSITMLVMILMYTGLNGSHLFDKSLLSDTGNRLRMTPVSKPALVGGLLTASTVTSFLQGMVTFIFSGVVYGVNWGDRVPLVLLTLFGIVLFSQSICIFLTMLFRNHGAVIGISQTLFFVMAYVSKSYAKMSFGAADKIFQYTPNAMAHTVIFGAIYGGNEAKMMADLAIIFALCAVLFILAFALGRRRLV